MMAFLIGCVVVLIGAVVALVLGRLGSVSVHMPESVSTMGGRGLPVGPLSDADIADVRFDRTLRGYRMSEVDEVMDRLRAELADREAELAELRAMAVRTGPLDSGYHPGAQGFPPDGPSGG